MTDRAIHGQTASGGLFRVEHTVYLVGSTDYSEPRKRLGVTLAYGGDAALSGRAALDGWDFTRFTRKQRDTPLEVVTSTSRRLRIDDVKHVHSRRFSAEHRVWHDGEWVASVAWTITDLGRTLTRHQLANVIHQAAYHHRTTPEEIEELLAHRGSYAGARTVRRAIKLARSGSAGTRSFSEDRFLEIAALVTRRIPIVNTPMQFGSERFEPDFVWVRERVIFEIDGGQHGFTTHSQLDDEARDAACRAAGFTVIRIPWRMVWDQPVWCAERVARALGAGGR